MARATRIFFASDIHGSERCFLKFLNAGTFYKADVLIMGGDITGKVVVPILPTGSAHEAHFLGQTHRAGTEDELKQLEKAIRFNGFYPARMTREEYDAMKGDEAAKDALFHRLVGASLRRWMEVAEERLSGLGIRCLINPGNDDEWIVDDILGQSGYVENRDGTVVDLDDDHEMITVGYSNTTPFDSPREMSEERLEEHLYGLAKKLRRPRGAVFTLHAPPFGSGLDSAPLLKDREVVTRGGHTVMAPVGSRAVRAVIEEVQPLLGLHGHVHESRGVKKIGRTLCLNPGSEYSEGILHGALITLGRDKVAGYQLVTA